MAKDPAFLFFPGDWLGGTMNFTRHHKGAYMDLLMCQFSMGHMDIEDIKVVLGADFDLIWLSKLKCKFKVDPDGKFFNEKLENEIFKRRNFTDSRKNNLKSNSHKEGHKKPDKGNHMRSHMENGNGNEDINTKENVFVPEEGKEIPIPKKKKEPKKKADFGIPSETWLAAVGCYVDFYKARTKTEVNPEGLKPKFDNVQGAKLKDVLKHLHTFKAGQTWDDAIDNLKAIFANWGKLDKFYQDQIDLKNIHSNLNNIINGLTSKKGNNTTIQSVADLSNQYL